MNVERIAPTPPVTSRLALRVTHPDGMQAELKSICRLSGGGLYLSILEVRRPGEWFLATTPEILPAILTPEARAWLESAVEAMRAEAVRYFNGGPNATR